MTPTKKSSKVKTRKFSLNKTRVGLVSSIKMEKVGTVVGIFNGRAKVRCLYRCDSECSFCPASHLFAKSDEPLELEALNQAGAKEGDTVRIELDAAASLGAYGLAYGVPILGLVAGALAGAAFVPRFPRLETLLVVGGAILGAAAGLAFAVLRGRRFHPTPVIAEILTADMSAENKGSCDG